MGHQFARAAAAAAVALVLAGCSDGGADADPPPVLENAREQVADASGADDAAAGAVDDDTGSAGSEVPAELPAPDPSTFVGANRVVNVWVGAGGETGPIDVWARRTFTNGPVLLAESVPFGSASAVFAAPIAHDLVVVGAGAGPDGEMRAEMLNAGPDQQITTLFTNADAAGSVGAVTVFEEGTDQSPEPPDGDNGLVRLFAPNLRAFSAAMIASIGADGLAVGDSAAACRPQRSEADGFAPSVLGGTQAVEIEVPPGPNPMSLHPWSSQDGCVQPSVLDLVVDVASGSTTLVIVFTRDGSDLETLTLPPVTGP